MKIKYTNKTDVLIIGGGAAGIKAAIKAGEAGADVLVVTKCAFGYTGATFYPGTPGWGMDAIIFDGDNVELFTEEILDAGAGAADIKLAKILAMQCTERFHELEEYGLEFSKNENGNYYGVIPCFGKRMRGSTTYGIDKIRKAMWLQLMKNNVSIRSRVSVISLIIQDSICIGAVGIDEMDELMFIHAKSVILATGGACGIYRYGLATPEQTGDGYIMAIDVGARLVNMEFIQFIPGLTWPVNKNLFQEKNLDTMPLFTNRYGEDILKKYLPPEITVEECLVERAKHGPFSTSTISRYVDIAMYEEWRLGNVCDSGGIHLQYSPDVLKDQRQSITKWLEWMNSKGIDVVSKGFDMIPHAQCFNGGIYINEDCSTGVKGLFSAGENAGGPHGADRLGGAAIAATQVFGAIAGTSAVKWAKENRWIPFSNKDIEEYLLQRFDLKHGSVVDIEATKGEIRNIMWECGAIVRSEERLNKGLIKIDEIEHGFNLAEHYRKDHEFKKAAEVSSFIKLSKILLEVMKYRKESRGPHYRIDFPYKDKAFKGVIAVSSKDNSLCYEIINQF